MLITLKREFREGKNLLQFGFLAGVGQALGMIAPLVVAKFFASEELYASYSLANMVVFLFLALLVASPQTPFIIFANQERARTGKINKAFSVRLSLLGLGVLVFFVLTLALNNLVCDFAKIGRLDLIFVVLAFVGLASKSLVTGLFMGTGQRIKSSAAELIFGATVLFGIIVFYRAQALNLRTVFLTYLMGGLAVVVLCVKLIDFGRLLPFAFDRQLFKQMVDFTKWVLLGATAVYFINWGGIVVLRVFCAVGVVSMGDIGSYNLGYQIFKGVIMLTYIVGAYFLPFVSEHVEDEGKMRDYLYAKRPKILIVGFVLIGLFFVVAPYAFKMAYGDVYEGSVMVVRILLVGSAMMLYAIFYEPILNSLKRYKFIQAVNVTQVLLSLVGALVLVPLTGLAGAALATVFAYLFRAAAMKFYFEMRLKDVFKA